MLKSLVLTAANVPAVHAFVTKNPAGRQLASRFVAGSSLDEAIDAARQVNTQHIHTTLDHLGENTTSAEEAASTANDYIAILQRIAETGVDANISIKPTALGLDISEELCLDNMRKVLQVASQNNTFVRVDMEGSAYTERTLRITHILHAEFAGKSTEIGGCVGTVIQTMLYRSADDVEHLIQDGIRVRLVKGAYRESSAIAFPDKSDVDENYRQLMYRMITHGVYPAIATHDERLIADAKHFAQENSIDKSRFEFQMLYGIRRDIQEQLATEGYHVRVYIPYGTQWYPYLTRRMAERPANLFFILSNAFRG